MIAVRPGLPMADSPLSDVNLVIGEGSIWCLRWEGASGSYLT